ncbi:MAG: cell wall-binding repeat-containing protein [Actinomycetota bacterium]|nr:cell wall-binding repeat-containing protein [Actinomycetota bacterium]
MLSTQATQRRLWRLVRFACVAVLICATLPTPALADPIRPASLHIAIDAGHGGGYSGAYYGGTAEKTLNLAIAKKVAATLRSRGYRVTLTRSDDTKVYRGGGIKTWLWDSKLDAYRYSDWPATDSTDRLRQDLQARCDVANASGADLFVSIHNNAASSSAVGAESYRAPNDPLGNQFAEDVQDELIDATGASDRGVHSAKFYVIRWSNMPAVLVECGFMSNSSELSRLRSSSYQGKVARGIADGIERFADRTVDETFDRWWGADRYETAAAVSRAGWDRAPAVVLASGVKFADSLVAAPLATKLGGPILTTGGDKLPNVIAGEIKRLAPSRIVVVGGPDSVPDSVVREAAAAAGLDVSKPAQVRRIGGRDRYEVSMNVAREMSSEPSTGVVVASGEVFPDALSIAASAAQKGQPILLASRARLAPQIKDYIVGGDKQRPVTVVGGTTTLPEAVLEGIEYTRLAGATRYETNWAVFNARYDEAARLRPVIASSQVFPDALVVGPLAAREGRPILLVGKSAMPGYVRQWVYNRRAEEIDAVVAGGPASISAYISKMFVKMEMNSY